MTEAVFKRKVLKELKEVRNTYVVVKEALSLRGFPDIIACVNGTFVGLELKRSKKEAEKDAGRIVLQRYNIRQINIAKGKGYIVHPDNWDEVLEELRRT